MRNLVWQNAINESTIYSASGQCYKMLGPTEEMIKSGAHILRELEELIENGQSK